MQKYPMKSKVRSCHKWSEFSALAAQSYANDLITYPSYVTLRHGFNTANMDDVQGLQELKELLLKALNGRKI